MLHAHLRPTARVADEVASATADLTAAQERRLADDPAAQPATSQASAAPLFYVPAKDHLAAGVLAILFGVFGIHKFYLGLPAAGFATLSITVVGGLLTFGLAALAMVIIGIVEGVIYLTKGQAVFEHDYLVKRRGWF